MAGLAVTMRGQAALSTESPGHEQQQRVAALPSAQRPADRFQVAQDTRRHFDIPPQPLAEALVQFARQSGFQVSLDPDTVAGLETPGINRAATPREALGRLLQGSGLTPRFSGRTIIVAQAATVQTDATLATINVEGGEEPAEDEGTAAESAWGPVDGIVATRSATATKTDTPILETPQSVSVVTADQVKQQGAESVSDALSYTPGVFVQPQAESSRYDETRIRGFQALQFLDGLRLPFNQFWGQPSIDPYGLERIEVLKGPSSALYGQNAPGGIINMVSKRPTSVPFGEVILKTGSYNQKQGAFDFGGPANDSGTFLFRMTGLVNDSETQVDFTKDDRFFIAPSFTWRPSADTSFTFLSNYGEDNGTYPHQYLPAEGTLLANPNGRIPRSRFAGEPGFDDFERTQWWAGYVFDHRFNDVWSVHQNLRYAHVDSFFNAIRSEGLEPDQRTLNRNAFTQMTDSDVFAVDNQLQGDFASGALRHELLLGVDYRREAGDVDFRFAVAPALDIFDPNYGAPVPPRAGTFMDNYQSLNQLGVYAQDQIELGNWNLTLSGRHDWAEVVTDDHFAGTTTKQEDTAFTGRAGLSYLFPNGIAPFVAYGTSFQPQTGTDPSGSPFGPTTGRQYEAGIKYQPPGSKTLVTVSAFDLEQADYVTFDPSGVGHQSGLVSVRGFEVDAKTELTDNLELIAAYSYLDSEVLESANPIEIGRPFPMTPEHQASAWAYYSFDRGPLDGLGLGAGVRYVGANFSEIGSADSLRVPSYHVFDAAFRYDLGKLDPTLEGVEFAVNATNLADKYYVTYCFGRPYCSLGEGRAITASITRRW